jgi:hypothetical protein
MRKVLILFIFIAMLFSITACSESNPTSVEHMNLNTQDIQEPINDEVIHRDVKPIISEEIATIAFADEFMARVTEPVIIFDNFTYRVDTHSIEVGFPNFISVDHSDENCTWYSPNHGVDITTGTKDEDEVGHIRGMPTYAQGAGTVIEKGGSENGDRGFYVVITYDNGFTARYLHLKYDPTISGRIDHTDIIGYVGDTGSPGNNHLHMDVNTGGLSCGIMIRDNPRYVVRALSMFPDETFRRN